MWNPMTSCSTNSKYQIKLCYSNTSFQSDIIVIFRIEMKFLLIFFFTLLCSKYVFDNTTMKKVIIPRKIFAPLHILKMLVF